MRRNAGRTLLLALAIAVASGLLREGWPHNRDARAAELIVEVTSIGDGIAPGDSVCPSTTLCTLRRAIEFVNADASEGTFVIRFPSAIFPPGEPATISVLASPLPPVTRPGVSIDGAGAGVILSGLSLGVPADGVVLTGDDGRLRGLTVRGFSGSCIVAAGARTRIGDLASPGAPVAAGGCTTAVDVRGAESAVVHLRAGFEAFEGQLLGLGTGIQVSAAGVTVGAETQAGANYIGNATAGVRVGASGIPPFGGTRIVRNVIGENPASEPAPVSVAIELRQPSSNSIVEFNTLANAAAGVRVAADSAEGSVAGNTVRANRFHEISGLPIDLNADGEHNPNDAGDGDSGANTLRNHPLISRAVQSRISGTAGQSCAGCSVELYVTDHQPGARFDSELTPLAVGAAAADPLGAFAFENPPVVPGQWVTALVTDALGSTSEFGPSVRVGAGVVQCGNVTIGPGWNNAGFFGASSQSLGLVFPPEYGLPSRVTAIYGLIDGSEEFSHWFAGTSMGRTLDSLAPGDAYWYEATAAFTLVGGFSLSGPFPVQLESGWNNLVYIGASADARDALASIAGKYTEVFRWETTPEGGRWLSYGSASTPSWARGFSRIDACSAYLIHVTEDVTLTPLQP